MLDRLWLPNGISTVGHRVDPLFVVIFWATLVVWALMTAGMFAFMVTHRHRPSDSEQDRAVKSNPRVELMWTAVTAIILAALVLMSRSTWAGSASAGGGFYKVADASGRVSGVHQE